MTFSIENESLEINEGTERHSFGCKDEKGREIGAVIQFRVAVLEEAAEAQGQVLRGAWRKEPGTYFCFHVQQVRDGKIYGAAQSWTWCKTEAERIAKVAKYLKSAKARAAKKAL
jgi:hypothetical protein